MVIMYKEMNAYIVGCHKNDGNDDYLLYYYGNGISLTSSAPEAEILCCRHFIQQKFIQTI